jgi:hypothetical protein
MSYTAILFCVDPSGGQSFTMSRTVDTVKLEEIYPYLRSEAKVSDDSIDQILLLANGEKVSKKHLAYEDPPKVLHMWRAEEGDFALCQVKTFTADEAIAHIKEHIQLGEWDNQGQIVIYTNLYSWNDGSIRDAPDPNWEG